jgi:dCMP deaminase
MTLNNKFEAMFVDVVKRTAELSTCAKHHVGAILVKDNRILLQGYNGTTPGFTNCTTLFGGCDFSDSDKAAEHKAWSAAFEVHAEMNVLMYAAKEGISVKGATMYCTHTPCNNCLKHLISAGISKVVFLYNYQDIVSFEERNLLLEKIDVVQYGK